MKAEIVSYWEVSVIYYYIQEWMKYQKYKSKNLFFYKIFLNFHFSVTIAYEDLKCCLHSLHTHSEGTVSQIFYLGLSFYFMSKNGKHFLKFVSIIFEIA